MVTLSAVSIWRRLASSGPHNAASRTLSTGLKATSSAVARRRALMPGSRTHALHRHLERLLERVAALGQGGARLLRQALAALVGLEARDQRARVLAQQRARVRGRGAALREHQRHAANVLALEVAPHERDVRGALHVAPDRGLQR